MSKKLMDWPEFKYRHLGASEVKRKNLLNTYEALANAIDFLIKDNETFDNLKENKKIRDVFLEYRVYEEDKKSFDVSREISLAKRMNILVKKDNPELGFVGKFLIDKNEYFAMKRFEIFSIYLAQTKWHEDKSFLFKTIELTKKPINEKDFLHQIGFPQWDKGIKILNKLIDEKNYEPIIELIKFGSGTPGKDGKQKDLLRDEILLSIFDSIINNWTKENIIYLLNKIEKQKILKKITPSAAKALKSLIIYPELENSNIKSPNTRIIINKIDSWYSENINKGFKLMSFHKNKKKNDYDNLNKGHLFHLPFIKINKNGIQIREEYKKIVYSLYENDFISKPKDLIDIEKYLTKLKITNDVKVETVDIQNEVNDELLIKTFKQNKEWHLSPEEIIEIFGSNVSRATIYEFISCLAIYKLMDDFDIEKFLKGLRTKLNSDNLPRTHAPGGVADAIFKYKEDDVIIEPTLMVKGAAKHEYNITKHIRKENASYAIMVSPGFEKDTIDFIWKTSQDGINEGKIIIPITNKKISMILSKENNKEAFEEYIIGWRNSFSDLDSFKEYANNLN